MSRESIVRWAEGQANRNPRPGYCTGPHRFGSSCYDCSGFTYMAYQSDGKIIPADSSLVARWGRDNGQVHGVLAAKLADLMVHDKYGDPYNSTGPRGHIGLFASASGGRVLTYESAGSGKGVGLYSRPANFWAISVQHPAFAGTQPDPPAPTEDNDLTPEQDNRLKAIEMLVTKHDDMLGWLFGMEVDGGYENRGKSTPRIQQVLADTQAIRKKTGA